MKLIITLSMSKALADDKNSNYYIATKWKQTQ